MRGNIRIGGALVMGMVVILGALLVKNEHADSQAGSVVVSQASARNYIEYVDSDGDGIKDWEESLQDKFIETIETSSSTLSMIEAEPYTPPSTLTGKFSEAFIKDYLQKKMDGEDFAEPTEFINTAVTAIEKNAQSITHNRLELTIVDSSPEIVHEYGNAVSQILRSHSINNKNEMTILEQAVSSNNPKILEDLAPIRAVYSGTIGDLLAMEVPDTLVSEHLNLLDACEAIRTDIEAMQVAFSDPLYTLARVKGYEYDSKKLFTALGEVGNSLTKNGASYKNDEPGAFFYIFDTDSNTL